jgi:hypothetical protein
MIMTRTSLNILILTVLILVLCVCCFVGRPLITCKYVPEMNRIAEKLNSTYLGNKIVSHYLERPEISVSRGIASAEGITADDNGKKRFLLCGRLYAAVISLTAFIASIALFVVNSGTQQPSVSKARTAVIIALVVIAGTLVRLIIAAVTYGNYDMESYEIVTGIVGAGGNVYASTIRYNYSPVWFAILFVLKEIQLISSGVTFSFVVKSFLCVVDLLTLLFLLLIADIRKLPAIRTAIFFYLNPVSFLITGYHGQFDNLAMLMVLIGIFVYLRLSMRPVLRTTLLWLFASAGMFLKHNIFYELIICLNVSIKRYRVKMLLLAISIAGFLAMFIPYWQTGSRGIIRNVFSYGSLSGYYGITVWFDYPELKYLFIPAMVIFPFVLKGRDIIAHCLLGVLFFLTFTTGFGVQYFILPVAIGAIRPSRFSLFYTIAAGALLLGNSNNVFIPGFHLLRLNTAWIMIICWFVSEMWLDRRAAGIAAENLDYC